MKLILVTITFFSFLCAFGQTDKQIDKAIKVFDKDYTKGIAKLNKYMSKVDMPRLRAWEVLVDMEYLDYMKYADFWENLKVVNSTDGESDTVINITGENLFDILTGYSKESFLNTCRSATILSQSTYGDYHLRMINLEVDPDTLVSEKAQSYFDEGEEFFEKDDYELAIMNFKKAYKEQPDFYNACIQLGISYWRLDESADSSLHYLGEAKLIQPTYLEPIKIRVEVLVKQGLYFRAKKECLDGLCVYPGFDMKGFYNEVLYVENKYMDENRLYRSFYPNNMDFEDKVEYYGVFAPYRKAKYNIVDYCDEAGLIEENGEIEELYLEVYSWKVLLEYYETRATPGYLKFAEEMLEDGYLDCYVLVSLFHYDLYPQFKHFMSFPENRERTKEYIEKYLIKTYN